MSQQRMESLRAMAEAQPEEALVWYGLANEYVKLAHWREAVDALSRVVSLNPDYTSAYQLLGTAHANLGEHAEARRAWGEGVEVAKRTGAWKAQRHMESLLGGQADAEEGSGLCQE